jgi:hypothetical protein
MKYSLHQFLKAVVGLKADNWAAGTQNGTGIDRLGFEEALVILNAGINGTSGTVNAKVQESDDNSTFTDITGAAFAQVTESNDDTIYIGRINLIGRKRYIRCVAVVATAACDLGMEVVLGAAKILPTTPVNAVSFNVN